MQESTPTIWPPQPHKILNVHVILLATDQNLKFTLLSHSALSISGKKTWKKNRYILFFHGNTYLRECHSNGILTVCYDFFGEKFQIYLSLTVKSNVKNS